MKLTTRVNCKGYLGGKVFSNATSAAAEHRRLRSLSPTSTASSSSSKLGWCASANQCHYRVGDECIFCDLLLDIDSGVSLVFLALH